MKIEPLRKLKFAKEKTKETSLMVFLSEKKNMP